MLRLPHVYEDSMLDEALIQRDHPIPQALTIHLQPRHASFASFRIRWTREMSLSSPLEILLVGGLAAAAAYGIGLARSDLS